jgi:hypothetical protein
MNWKSLSSVRCEGHLTLNNNFGLNRLSWMTPPYVLEGRCRPLVCILHPSELFKGEADRLRPEEAELGAECALGDDTFCGVW